MSLIQYRINFEKKMRFPHRLIKSSKTLYFNLYHYNDYHNFTLLEYLLSPYNNDNFRNPWIECVRNILNACGCSNIWSKQAALNV